MSITLARFKPTRLSASCRKRLVTWYSFQGHVARICCIYEHMLQVVFVSEAPGRHIGEGICHMAASFSQLMAGLTYTNVLSDHTSYS